MTKQLIPVSHLSPGDYFCDDMCSLVWVTGYVLPPETPGGLWTLPTVMGVIHVDPDEMTVLKVDMHEVVASELTKGQFIRLGSSYVEIKAVRDNGNSITALCEHRLTPGRIGITYELDDVVETVSGVAEEADTNEE